MIGLLAERDDRGAHEERGEGDARAPCGLARRRSASSSGRASISSNSEMCGTSRHASAMLCAIARRTPRSGSRRSPTGRRCVVGVARGRRPRSPDRRARCRRPSSRSTPSSLRQLAHRRRRLHRAAAGGRGARACAAPGRRRAARARGARGGVAAHRRAGDRGPGVGDEVEEGRADGDEVADLGAERRDRARLRARAARPRPCRSARGRRSGRVSRDRRPRPSNARSPPRPSPPRDRGARYGIGSGIEHASSAATTRAASGRHQSSTAVAGERRRTPRRAGSAPRSD